VGVSATKNARRIVVEAWYEGAVVVAFPVLRNLSTTKAAAAGGGGYDRSSGAGHTTDPHRPRNQPPYPVKPIGTIDKQDLQDKSSPSYRPDWDLELGFGCWESPAANAPVGIQGRLE